jgi:hypothetical protein
MYWLKSPSLRSRLEMSQIAYDCKNNESPLDASCMKAAMRYMNHRMADRHYGMAFDNTKRDGDNDDGAAGSVANVQRQLECAYPVTVESAVLNAAEMVNRLSAL